MAASSVTNLRCESRALKSATIENSKPQGRGPEASQKPSFRQALGLASHVQRHASPRNPVTQDRGNQFAFALRPPSSSRSLPQGAIQPFKGVVSRDDAAHTGFATQGSYQTTVPLVRPLPLSLGLLETGIQQKPPSSIAAQSSVPTESSH